MRRIERLPFGVNSCAVLQNRATDPEGFIATDGIHPLTGRRVYVSYEAIRIMGHQFGMATREEVAGIREDLADANHRIAQLEQELNDATLDFQAIDRLESKGYQARKKAGRPLSRKN